MDKELHIVCLDVPYPADYGGVFDLFYKLKALHELGIKIHLHCYEYGRGKQTELNKYCVYVHYYKRSKGFKGFSFSLPYIVNSRKDDQLLLNLMKDDHPILLEGIHCTYLLHQKLNSRKVFVRLHNVEFEYYRQLAKSETSLFKKLYFLHESMLLKKHENSIANKATFIAVSKKDAGIYKKIFNTKNIKYLPVFIAFQSVTSKEGKGNFCLYHGNLSVSENEKAIAWLLKNIFNDLKIPLVIAGKNPSHKLEKLIHDKENCCLVANPTDAEMNELINKAQVNILPSFNSTGIKIKLLNALFNGRHILVNKEAVEGTGLQNLCVIADGIEVFKKQISVLYDEPFTNEQIELRKKILLTKFNNEENAMLLIKWIWH